MHKEISYWLLMTYDGYSDKAIMPHILSNYNSHTSVTGKKKQMRIDIVFDEIAEYLIQQYTATSKHNQVDIVPNRQTHSFTKSMQ